jgi:16S rRNA (cytosine967-C5)-methyltransferase
LNDSNPLSTQFVQAAREIARVYRGASLARANALEPAVQDLCYGSLRDFGYLDALIAALAHKPIADPELRALLACALRALRRERVAAHTVVNEAVTACGVLGFPAAKGLVNALLRNFLRQRSTLETAVEDDDVARWRHPRWWIDAIKRAYPRDWQGILEAGNTHPPMSLRVNRRRTSTESYAQRLEEAGIAVGAQDGSALSLSAPVPMHALPGFASGDVSVQDLGAQRAAPLLDVSKGMRVLDACAAPGGKTGHLLELADVELLALDRDAERLARVTDNLRRLGLHATVAAADAADFERWWDGRPFDRVLLDAPCTATGIVRRHPDIKWLRRQEDTASFAAQQAALLDALWRLLAPGGKLLYVTCSVLPEENAQQIESFLARRPDARREELPAAMPSDGQLLPNELHDGFYYALLKKNNAPDS